MSDLKENPFDFTIFKNWVGLLGNIIAIIFFISPITLMRKLFNNEISAYKIPYLILMMNVMNCVLWLSFGILNNDFFIIFGNAIGYVLNSIYLGIFFYFMFNKKILYMTFFNIVSLGITLSCLILLAFVLKLTELAKNSAMIFNILMYGAPGQKIVTNIFKF